MLPGWRTALEECLPSTCKLQEMQQLWQGRPLLQGLPHACEGSDASPGSESSSEPAEERMQQASGSGQGVCHDWGGDSRLR